MLIRKEESLKGQAREVERLKKEVEGLRELANGGSLSARGGKGASTSDYDQMIKDMEDRITKLQ